MTCHRQLNVNYFYTQMTLAKYFNTVTLMKLKPNLIRSIRTLFVNNKLRIRFGEDKTKSILFSSKYKVKKAIPLNTQCKGKKVKQYSKVFRYLTFKSI